MADDTALLSAHPGHGEIQDGIDHLDGAGCMPESASAIRLLDAQNEARRREIDRLTAELAKYTGWEPTVREEYEHACDQLRRIEGIVKWFDADRGLSQDPLALASNVDSFVASLKHALDS
jgi:hypothetical protein